MKIRLLAFLSVLVLLVSAIPAASASEREISRAADTLLTLGLIDHTEDLNQPVTRIQAAEMLVKLAASEEAASADNWISGFRDVPGGWPETAVNYAVHMDWINGVKPMEFRPNGTLSANAWSAFLLRMLGYSDQKGDFTISEAALFAQHIGMTSHVFEGTLTRGSFYQMILDVLNFSYCDGSSTVMEKLLENGVVSQTAANALGYLNPTLTARQIADRCTSAVFCITTYDSLKSIREEDPYSDASGFFITADGIAVTNYHSIEDAIYATATLTTGEVYEIERVLYYDPDVDVAVLKVSQTSLEGKTTSAFAFLETADTVDVRPGDTVYSLGNPLGQGLAIGSGVISATNRKVEQYAIPCFMNTASISRGSSGGALLNEYGHVVAITTGAFTYGNNMYLAIPIDAASSVEWSSEGFTLQEVLKMEQNREK